MKASSVLGRIGAALLIVALAVVSRAATSSVSWVNTETVAHPTNGALFVSYLTDSEPVSVTVSLKLRNQDQLQQVANAVAAGQAAPISHAEFMTTYAPTEAQAQAVTSYLASVGFSNIIVDPNRLLIRADGTAQEVYAAFNTSLAHYSRGGRTGFVNINDVQVPVSLADSVLAVLGLQNLDTPSTPAIKASPSTVTVPTAIGPGTVEGAHAFDPISFPGIYGASALSTGSATAVAIVSEGSLTQVLSDLSTFETDEGLPSISPSVVNVGGTSSDTSEVAEWDLDSQDIQAMAGGYLGSLTFYVAPALTDGDLASVYSRIVSDDSAKLTNISLEECESSAHSDGSQATDDGVFLSGVAQGQVFSVASGDNGSRICGATGNGTYGTSTSVSYPASSPSVVAVGGSTLLINTDGSYASESAWSYSGGGQSAYEAATQWEQGEASVPFFIRSIPDVAMDADPNTGADIVVNGSYSAWGGTSLASPLFVGLMARVESANSNAFSFPNPLMYFLQAPSSAFHDITSGNNDDYNAETAWDYTTGWGSLGGSALSTALVDLPTAPISISNSGNGIACPHAGVSWSSVSGATSHELWNKETTPPGSTVYTVAWTGSGTSTTVTLSSGTAFSYKASACTSDGCSQLSSAATSLRYGRCP